MTSAKSSALRVVPLGGPLGADIEGVDLSRAIDDETLAGLLQSISDIEPYLPDRPSYFEILTAAAFEHFADVAVDAAVVEVGVGGRWDATNVADGRIAVVTNVTIDHVDYLGPTRSDIAHEKAGIVKPDSTLVLGETDPDLVAIFEAARGAPAAAEATRFRPDEALAPA